jgi:probable rRNA maturation factor
MANAIQKKIYFHFSSLAFNLPDRMRLKHFMEYILKSEEMEFFALTIIFCDNRMIKRLNKKYLHHNQCTDIITFRLSEKVDPLIGDIYISQEQVLRNSERFHTSFKMEIHRVIFHGVLHLCGYNDKTKDQQVQMRKAENKYLNLYFNGDLLANSDS